MDKELAGAIVERLFEDMTDRQSIGDAFEELSGRAKARIFTQWTKILMEEAE